MATKKYGLILQDKEKVKTPPIFKASRNVFGNDSDTEEEIGRRTLLLRPSDNTARQAKITQDKAVIEDPTVYQYDEIYEEMSSKKEKEKVKTKVEKKPQYIEKLMKAANKRKVENERRIERQIQKEREKEGDEFKDKEVFVTSAYKKKLEEMRIEEEKEKREEYLESIGDVTKQRDLGGFYRHLYEQKLGKGKSTEENKADNKNPLEKINEDKEETLKKTDANLKRNYRKRESTDSKKRLSEGEIEDSDEEINRLNLEDIRKAKRSKHTEENIDADSDFSIDESSDEENTKKAMEVKQSLSETKTNDKTSDVSQSDKKSKMVPNNLGIQFEADMTKESKPKVDIWKKRTVGVVLEEALKRYYARKAARGS